MMSMRDEEVGFIVAVFVVMKMVIMSMMMVIMSMIMKIVARVSRNVFQRHLRLLEWFSPRFWRSLLSGGGMLHSAHAFDYLFALRRQTLILLHV